MAIWNCKNFLGVIRHLKAVKLEEQRIEEVLNRGGKRKVMAIPGGKGQQLWGVK